MRFSIRTLFLFTTTVAVTVASLVYANAIIGDLFYTLGLLTIAFSVLAAIYRRGSDRAFWVGFTVLFAGYFCLTVLPLELPAYSKQRLGSSSILTNRLLSLCFNVIHDTSVKSSIGNPYYTTMEWATERAEQYMSFMTIGHTSIAFLFGVLGGVVAQRFATRSVGINAKNEERAAASPPAAHVD